MWIIKIFIIQCSYPPRILNEHWCIYSCLQIPPRENWFQYVRRVYATAINFPCIIILVTNISLRYTPPECWMLQGVPINMRLNPLFNLIHNCTSKSFVWWMNEWMSYPCYLLWKLCGFSITVTCSFMLLRQQEKLSELNKFKARKTTVTFTVFIRYNLIWHDPL